MCSGFALDEPSATIEMEGGTCKAVPVFTVLYVPHASLLLLFDALAPRFDPTALA